ncbi:MAG TPA: HEAT repeat domain-containing protein [Planctomycetota bacterium]
MIRFALRVLLAVVTLAVGLSAHGGQYRSVAPTGKTSGQVAVPASWQAWWESNKEPYLRREPNLGPQTGSDDFYLGRRRPEVAAAPARSSEDDRRSRIVPALVALIESERSRDVQSACLVALGKVGLDAPGVDLEAILAARIARDDQEVRETAVLSLGIAGRPTCVGRLQALVRDDAEGRKIADQAEVGERLRTFATYGLALTARRSGETALQQQVYDLLWSLLCDPATKSRDLRVACVLGIGILRADPERSSDKRFAWRAVEELLAWFERDAGAGEEFVQEHAPISIARLLGRGTSPLHGRCKKVFSAVLEAGSRRGNAILSSAAIALGMMSLPPENHAEDAHASKALQLSYERGAEEHVRMFSVMALGRIGGAGNRAWLLSEYPRGNKTMEKPWLAIGLGVFAAGAAQSGAADEEVARLLLRELETASHEDMITPLAVAVGLTRHKPAAAKVLAMLRDRAEVEQVSAYLCMSLGLLGEQSAVPTLVEVLERSKRRPILLQQCAVALGSLGDGEVTKRLVKMLREDSSVAVLAAVASAIIRIGDRGAIDALIAASADTEVPKLGRAFVAAALGGVGDKDPLPWHLPLSVDANYSSPVDTLTNGTTGILDIL